ncbi:MAG: hypothetical protein UU48_C0011G0006 [Candidatus Uhrbacteria bacterium GW2011_GWF2_41_16]|uniref:Uncharacterized protein n=2 Tax=Candidatus Uhriibacteriota TaxID=1752732 RepID=A0A0G0V9K0_9BACT|nr:MAG: hypothetical protein UU31_C0004G0005 [Candidatus Uhrbacteria bacterium GW2011_GWA2_41_10]KKR87050.1 MAG: hypothetical protein UU35_C0006G0003 [Candidatus Uhrbacteria bacterium GW2011_GWC2_41_11]KKR97614.1 MAG: hypothetical protein UU48_C0011G0006 [Candidatus Uhrbacteria bacterium GW2011_GWF2_41_16]
MEIFESLIIFNIHKKTRLVFISMTMFATLILLVVVGMCPSSYAQLSVKKNEQETEVTVDVTKI